MPEVTLILYITAFVAGLLMFLAPCTLPLVPAFLAFISGLKSTDALTGDQQRLIRINALAYVSGFSLVFISFGVFAGSLGSFFGVFRDTLSQVGGIFIILFGLVMLNVFSFTPLRKQRSLQLPASLRPGTPLSAGVIGVIFALGWTPCVGPILASILLLSSTAGTALAGASLLAVFSLGLALPFLLVAFLYSRLANKMQSLQKISGYVSTVGGVFLIGIGLLLLTGSFGLMVEYGYKVFYTLGLEVIFEYL